MTGHAGGLGDVIWAFSADHIRTLTGLSKHQLRYWDETGFFSPQYTDTRRRRPYGRVYSFRDVVGLRVIAMLRRQYRVSLQELRPVGKWLSERLSSRPESTWSSIVFYVSGRRAHFDDPVTGVRIAGRGLQPALPIEMKKITDDLAVAIRRLQQRGREDLGRITQHRYVVHNAPVLAGTRIPTRAIWNLREAGYRTTRIIAEYPRLKRKDIREAIRYEEEHRRRQAG